MDGCNGRGAVSPGSLGWGLPLEARWSEGSPGNGRARWRPGWWRSGWRRRPQMLLCCCFIGRRRWGLEMGWQGEGKDGPDEGKQRSTFERHRNWYQEVISFTKLLKAELLSVNEDGAALMVGICEQIHTHTHTHTAVSRRKINYSYHRLRFSCNVPGNEFLNRFCYCYKTNVCSDWQ